MKTPVFFSTEPTVFFFVMDGQCVLCVVQTEALYVL
jgi:hypothetical protein